LVKAPKDTPHYWQVSFEVINLLSRVQTQLETVGTQPLSKFNEVVFRGGAPSVIANSNVLLSNHIEGFNFVNSVIHFDSSVILTNVAFQNCVFIFPSEANPSEPLQKIGEILLASDLLSVKIGMS